MDMDPLTGFQYHLTVQQPENAGIRPYPVRSQTGGELSRNLAHAAGRKRGVPQSEGPEDELEGMA